ncbi:MAG: cytochrome o ubiquinol oxidase subunit III [Patescibacteria group bacterium]
MKYIEDSKTTLGFWIYLMTDCVLFASLFATFAVLRNNTFGGPGGNELFSLPFVLLETLILLISSFVCGLAVVSARKQQKDRVIRLLVATVVLGLMFIGLEINEFRELAAEGNDWQRSAFLSSFFTLVGTHGLHICLGLLWASFLIVRLSTSKLTGTTVKRLFLFSLFWHFLDIVWIFIFTIVYLMGALS